MCSISFTQRVRRPYNINDNNNTYVQGRMACRHHQEISSLGQRISCYA